MIGHPAPYSKPVLAAFADEIDSSALVLDPFAGTGRIHTLDAQTVGVELEPEWARMSDRTIVGNALALPFADATFDVVATSPCYGNRMADHHEAKDACKKCGGNGLSTHCESVCRACLGTGLSMRKTYRHQLGRKLSADSAAGLQWGNEYREFHLRAWSEVERVLRDDGTFLLNVSNHIRKGEEVDVVTWHVRTLRECFGFHIRYILPVKTRRMKLGANRELRVASEVVIKLRKGV